MQRNRCCDNIRYWICTCIKDRLLQVLNIRFLIVTHESFIFLKNNKLSSHTHAKYQILHTKLSEVGFFAKLTLVTIRESGVNNRRRSNVLAINSIACLVAGTSFIYNKLIITVIMHIHLVIVILCHTGIDVQK
jgi:hypothetical protein